MFGFFFIRNSKEFFFQGIPLICLELLFVHTIWIDLIEIVSCMLEILYYNASQLTHTLIIRSKKTDILTIGFEIIHYSLFILDQFLKCVFIFGILNSSLKNGEIIYLTCDWF